MTLLELKHKIDELLQKPYGYEDLEVFIAVKVDNPPTNIVFCEISGISIGDIGGHGPTVASIDYEEPETLLPTKSE